ncbi:hypothetical protein S245_006402 [Arachis hypogaea]
MLIVISTYFIHHSNITRRNQSPISPTMAIIITRVIALFFLGFAFLACVAQGARVTFKNKCQYTVWPGTLTGSQKAQLSQTGFTLAPGATNSLNLPSSWSGRFWGRTGCSNNGGRFTCATGDCGTGQVACNGNGGATPATLVEITVASNGGQDFYDVSNVDGFNLPLSVSTQGGRGTCKTSSCPTNINRACPSELQVKGSNGNVVGCKSACVAFGKPDELRRTVEEVELVDAHAHNIVSIDSNFPFIHAFSEAYGDAVSFSPHSLSFKRSLRDIAELYGSESSLEAIEEHRRVSGLQSISTSCFKAAGISTLLIDDGLKFDKKHDLEWHRSFTPVVGRILRIERVAEEILDEGLTDGSSWTLDSFTKAFVSKLKSYPFIFAGEIFGFKSIAAYRSGLEINPNVTAIEAEEGLEQDLSAGKPVRVANKNFVDYIFLQSLEVAQSYDLPMQIHTGFGDKDLDMRLSNPLHLRAVLEDKRFLKSRIVILHASYPFSREASYLASVYSQIYLDFGLAIPKLSVHGMISSVKELLELAPINKVMFSTDGYAFPETFYLGAKWSREVVFAVLRDACIDGDLSIPEAVEAAKDIFARNAIRFYKISPTNSLASSEYNVVSKLNTSSSSLESDSSLVRIIFVDGSGQHRCRVVPKKRFDDAVSKNGVGLARCIMSMVSFMDAPAEGSGLTAVGEIRLMPDLSTKLRIPWSEHEEMVLCDMQIKAGTAWEYCPREALRRVSKILKDEFNLEMKAGFENEFYLLKSITREGNEEWLPFDSSHYCSSSAFDAASQIFREISAAIHSLGISVEQLHAEAGNGQFEIALGYIY